VHAALFGLFESFSTQCVFAQTGTSSADYELRRRRAVAPRLGPDALNRITKKRYVFKASGLFVPVRPCCSFFDACPIKHQTELESE
jgi:hypothetical protein